MDAVLRGAVRACYAGLDTVALRRQIAERIAAPLGLDAHAFSVCDAETGMLADTVSSGLPAGLAAAFVQRVYPDEVVHLAAEMHARGRTVFSLPEHSAAARELLAEFGIHDQLYVPLIIDRRLRGSCCVMRASASVRVRAQTRSFLRRLAPHVARGFRAALRIDAARAADPAPDAGVGVLVVDGCNRRVVQTAPSSAIMSDLADPGVDVASELPIAILSVIAQVHRHRTSVVPAASLRVRGRSGRCYRVEANLGEPDACGRRAVVIVMNAVCRASATGELLGAYDLSPREREVVAGVVRGEPTKCIAASLGISPYTAKEHLDRASAKLGVRGRKELVAKLFTNAA
jgi:DNA-binding CsgD family transcriptional regulator